jgi:hypothetical protein
MNKHDQIYILPVFYCPFKHFSFKCLGQGLQAIVERAGAGSSVTPGLEGKPNANHVRARISYSRTQQLHNMDIITQCSK